MTVLDPMASASTLETYLVSTFSKIQDQYGQKLDISPAVPTLLQVLTGHIDAVKKYEFIGEAACQFSIRCILARVYSHLNDRILDALARKYRALNQLNKLVIREIRLKQQESVVVNLSTLSLISGVLYSFFGTTAVEKFIEHAVLQIAAIELGEATAKMVKQEEGPLAKLNALIGKESGHIEFSSQPLVLEGATMQWQITLTARLCNSSPLFSHKRVEASMKKAKNAAAKDVLQYFEKHPEEYERFKQSGTISDVVQPLPILQSEYSVVESNPPTPSPTAAKKKTTVKTEQPFDTSYSPDHFHVSYATDEDAIRKLSALLLGNSVDEEMSDSNGSPTKKRMRDHNEQQQTGLNGMMFPKSEPTTTPMDEQPDARVKSEIDYENVRQQLLAANNNSNTEKMDVNTTTTTTIITENNTTMDTTTTTTEPTHNVTDTPTAMNPYDVRTPEINPRILHYFKTIFRNNRNTLGHAVDLPGQSKSIFLSIVIQHSDKVKCDSELKQVGPPHGPVFSASVRLQSKEYQNVFIITEATAARKKDAECFAYHKLTTIFK